MFKLYSKFKPTGDQPQAIKELTQNLKAGIKHQVLLGVTGSGKTFVASNVIEKIQKPILVISHNKCLAAQLYQEFKEFFPDNAIHYFVSYYDYYQPEAYIPQTDTYIEKDAKINKEIDRLRHAAVQDLLTREDVIIIASVSCIYNIGSPESYQKVSLEIKTGKKIKRKGFLSHLTNLQYQRNDIDFKPGTFRVRGNIIDIFLVTGKEILRIEFLGDEIDKVFTTKASLEPKFTICNLKFKIYPAHFWITPREKLDIAIENIKLELQDRLRELKKEKKLLEAQRLEQRTNCDLEMLKETGFCHGIENYSRHLEFRKPGEAPFTLIDYYLHPVREDFSNGARDFLIFIDESHQTLPQLHGMYNQDKSRKKNLIEYGFRLPSALDNRPLKFEEFEKKINQARPNFDRDSRFRPTKKSKKLGGQVVYVSATPAKEEREKALRQARGKAGKKYIVEQLIRPTGLLEPSVTIKPIKNQVRDLIEEVKKQVAKKQRTLVLTLTKRLAEELADYLAEEGIHAKWLHAEVKTLERPQILKDLREGKYDVLVGINLLREGLDLPEVALVAILDADKEGFLRSGTTLIQIMGRAARHIEGQVILYADKITKSMKLAINEIKRRRKIQIEYNEIHNIIPKPIIKEIRDWPFVSRKKEIKAEFGKIGDVKLLEKEMKKAAKNLDFERAAEIRDLIRETKSGKK
ncbi:excinuclease ABC subunit UvrB [Patescibacteria group bacterium]|nr:excinuclease ABC subunit UvrB [Patescibacteria group bacterium]